MAGDTKECPYCGETIKAAAKKCRFCGEWLDGYTRKPAPSDSVGGDKIGTGDISDVRGAAVGRESMAASTGDVSGTFIQADGPVTLGKEQRDEQYEIALNWEVRGRPRLRGFDLAERDLSGIFLANADLRKSSLTKASLNGCDLRGSDLSEASLEEAILREADLRGADLHNANLAGADLTGATLAGADLRRAVLRVASLINADLREAKLSEANLGGAVFRGANFKGATFTSNTIWQSKDDEVASLLDSLEPGLADWWYRFDPEAAGAILVDLAGNPIRGRK